MQRREVHRSSDFVSYDDYNQRSQQGIRHAQATMPWWDPRYWRKRVWAGVAAVIIIIIVIAVAVGVTQAQNNAYPNYTELSYSLKETSESTIALPPASERC
jgi:hypothetical protein